MIFDYNSLIFIALILCQACSGALLNLEDEKAILDVHNKLRKQEGSSNMVELKWDPILVKTASAWADRCVWEHGHPDDIKTNYGYVGQNLYMISTNTVDVVQATEGWYAEKSDYTFDKLKCNAGKMCGHYTQVVWANTEFIGCGKAYCKDLSGWSDGKTRPATLLVCDYGEAGNFVGQKPFKVGAACSTCERDYTCRDGLCYKA